MFLFAERSGPNMSAVYAIKGFSIAVVTLYVAFWLWMLRDCVKNELPGSKQKAKWTTFIILFGPFAGLVYNVSRRKQRIRELGR